MTNTMTIAKLFENVVELGIAHGIIVGEVLRDDKQQLTPIEMMSGNVMAQMVTWLQNKATPLAVLGASAQFIASLFASDQIRADTNSTRMVIASFFVCMAMHDESVLQIHQHVFVAIGNLTKANDPSQDWLETEFNAIAVIVHAMKRFQAFPDVLARAFFALQKLCMGHALNIEKLFVQNHHLFVINCMLRYPMHEQLQTHACSVLRRISYIADTGKTMMATSCSLVLAAMRAFPSRPELLEHACMFLSNLAVDDDNKRLLLFAPYNVHELILQAMRTHRGSPVVQENGCSALWSLAFGEINKRILLDPPNEIHLDILTAMCIYPNHAAIQEEGCGALANLMPNSAASCMLVGLDAHMTLVASLRSHPLDESVQLQGTWALANLSIANEVRPALSQLEVLALCQRALQIFPSNELIKANVQRLEQRLQ